jgi:hypothetical protein
MDVSVDNIVEVGSLLGVLAGLLFSAIAVFPMSRTGPQLDQYLKAADMLVPVGSISGVIVAATYQFLRQRQNEFES